MIATHLLIATGFFTGAINAVLAGDKAKVSISVPLALGIFNSATTPTATIAVFNVRITSSMA